MSPEERRDELVDATLSLLPRARRDGDHPADRRGGRRRRGHDLPGRRSPRRSSSSSRSRGPSSPAALAERILEIDPDQPLEARLRRSWPSILQQRFRATLRADEEGRDGPARRPRARQPRGGGRPGARCRPCSRAVVVRRRRTSSRYRARGPRAPRCGCSPSPAATRTSPTGRCLTPEQIVDTLLHGLLRPRKERRTDAAAPPAHPPRAVQAVAGRHRGAAVHRDGRDALPAQPQRRHHRPGRGGRRHRLHPAHRRGHARGLAAPDPLLGRRGRLRVSHRDVVRP